MTVALLLGSTQGVFAASPGVSAAATRALALSGHFISHLAPAPAASTADQWTAVAAVPRLQLGPGQLHRMYGGVGREQPAQGREEQAGLHLLRPDAGGGASSKLVWAGDARACGIWPGGASGAPPQLAVGAEPADVFCSSDGGASFCAGTTSFAAAPTRSRWTFPPPPHEPHVLSLERLPSGQLVAGIEVGGVLVSGSGSAASSWEERHEGLYVDVHSCRIDPHDPAHWVAVTGRGLYATHDAGATWQPCSPGTWAGLYPVGLAFNPARPGEALVTAGDRPPGTGVHVFWTRDGGGAWRDITETVFGGSLAEARGGRTPVPYFLSGEALLGTSAGDLLAAADAARASWRRVCAVPHPITCMAAPGQSPSSVMH